MKVLIISFLWPPEENVGALRVSKFAKYLPRFGWQPTVLTVQNHRYTNGKEVSSLSSFYGYSKELENIRVIKTSYIDIVSLIKKKIGYKTKNCNIKNRGYETATKKSSISLFKTKLSNLFFGLFFMPDGEISWYKTAVRHGLDLLEDEKFDLIFSTSPSETCHLIARTLKRKTGIPWVADMRDLWSLDHFRKRTSLKRWVLSLMEKRTFKDVDALVTISSKWAKAEEKLCDYLKGRTFVIPNGYDNDDFKNVSIEEPKKFTLVYTGKLNKKYQNPEVLFMVLANLIDNGKIDRGTIDVKFYLIGIERPDVLMLSKKYGLDDVVKLCSPVGYKDSLKAQKSASVLLLFQWNGHGGKGWYSAKLFEYLGVRRPVLLVNADPEGEVANLIENTNAGYVADSNDKLGDVLVDLFGMYKTAKNVPFNGIESELSCYSRNVLTERLAKVFNDLA